MNWKNITSYSRGDNERIPRTWELSIDPVRIVITRHIHHAPDVWVLLCSPFCNQYEISNGTADEAKDAAVKYVHGCLRECLTKLDKLKAIQAL
jgi:hypothetical protein